MKQAKIISFFSLKGGVGKTTGCANIAIALGKVNLKVLLIDFDTNGNLSHYFNKKNKVDGIKKILDNSNNLQQVINYNVANNVDLISTNIDSAFSMINNWSIEQEGNLVEALTKARTQYDYIFIDLSASWNSQNKIILSHTDSIIWPIICTPFAFDSISNMLAIIRHIQTTTNEKLKIEGVFVNFFDKRKNDMLAIYSELFKTFDKGLYDTIIPQDNLIPKLQQSNKTIVGHASWKPSAIAFSNLAQEIFIRSRGEKNE